MSETSTDDTTDNIPNLTKEQVDELNTTLIESSLITSDVLYIELRLLRDYKLGALLRLMMDTCSDHVSETSYQILRSHLSSYAHREFDDLDHYVPGLPFTDQEVMSYLQTTTVPDAVLNASPMTEFIHTLLSHLMINANNSAVEGKDEQIQFIINTYPLEVSDRMHRLISNYITRLCAVDVMFICEDPKTLSKEILEKSDELYSFYLERLVKNEYLRHQMTNLKYLKKRFFGPKLFGYTYDKSKNTVQEQAYTNAVMNTTVQFKYLPVPYISPKGPNTSQEA